MNPIHVLVVHRLAICRHGLAAMIDDETSLTLSAAVESCQVFRGTNRSSPDVVILGQAEHERDFFREWATLLAISAQPKVVLVRLGGIGWRLAPEVVERVRCVLPMCATRAEIISSVQAAFAKGACSAAVRRADTGARAPIEAMVEPLTARERVLLDLMAQGHSNTEIGNRLGVALPTVKFHVSNIMSKLQAKNRTAAVLYGLKHELVRLS
jgi:two-component system, NarL family, response regulator LiaR